jgi:pyruvate dehydrogenase E2 component (dihydrolipoamide acetyltransferase)
MAFEITLPRLGWDMVEGSLGSWLKNDGEFVKEGEMLFSVEGDKAVQEIEALDSGYLRISPNCPQTGEKVPVGIMLGYLVPEDELANFKYPGSSQPEVSAPIAETNPASEPVLVGTSQPASPVSGGDRKQRIYISPFARRLAESLGVDWHMVKGSGLAGRIMARDVEGSAARLKTSVAAKIPQTAVSAPISVPSPAQPSVVPVSRLPMTKMRKKIAEHMAYSAHTAAPVTLTTEVNATRLISLRKALKEDTDSSGLPLPSYNDLLAKLSAQALIEYPMVNARIEGDEIIQLPTVNVAIAVETERGLIVPVLRDVQSKTLRQVARESAALIEKTRNGSVGYEDLQGATFTITNLGMFEIDAFTPIIDLPQCAILGVGRIVPKLVVDDVETERTSIQQRMFLSLTFDHRLIDGAQAARFFQRVKKLVENPYLWLVG